MILIALVCFADCFSWINLRLFYDKTLSYSRYASCGETLMPSASCQNFTAKIALRARTQLVGYLKHHKHFSSRGSF